jgi:predicted small secreted protein
MNKLRFSLLIVSFLLAACGNVVITGGGSGASGGHGASGGTVKAAPPVQGPYRRRSPRSP